MGTCGWSDPSLLKCGRFYPSSVKSAEERLAYYSSQWPCVEVDTSTYAIPRAESTKKWIDATSPGFTFHVKAFGLFCSGSAPASTLPYEVRARFSSAPRIPESLNAVPHAGALDPRP